MIKIEQGDLVKSSQRVDDTLGIVIDTMIARTFLESNSVLKEIRFCKVLWSGRAVSNERDIHLEIVSKAAR